MSVESFDLQCGQNSGVKDRAYIRQLEVIFHE
jgi:hypothetical protein